MNKRISYKNFIIKYHYNMNHQEYFGVVENCDNDIITVSAKTEDAFKEKFKISINEYLNYLNYINEEKIK